MDKPGKLVNSLWRRASAQNKRALQTKPITKTITQTQYYAGCHEGYHTDHYAGYHPATTEGYHADNQADYYADFYAGYNAVYFAGY